MGKIVALKAREILDSRGQPTLEVDLSLDNGSIARAAVPSGASTGQYEAHELRDGDPGRFKGKGVLKACQNIESLIFKGIRGMNVEDWKLLDARLLELDGTENKSNLGANAILAVSLACVRAAAMSCGKELFSFLGGERACRLPVPLMNVINGGAHANNGLDVQEFMIVPVTGGSFKEALRAGAEIFHTLKKILAEKGFSTAVGDEGGFAPQFKTNQEALDYLIQAIEIAGYRPGKDIFLALDVAATELQVEGGYSWQQQIISAEQMTEVYRQWAGQYPLISIEDGLGEDDWQGWQGLTQALGQQVQLVGDDLFVTNVDRLKIGVEQRAANAILLKVNQIGTLSETLKTVEFADAHSFAKVISHRSGETEDTTIADLAVAFDCQQIKTGSLCRSERTAKYNQLLRIEESLGSRAEFWGDGAFAK